MDVYKRIVCKRGGEYLTPFDIAEELGVFSIKGHHLHIPGERP